MLSRTPWAENVVAWQHSGHCGFLQPLPIGKSIVKTKIKLGAEFAKPLQQICLLAKQNSEFKRPYRLGVMLNFNNVSPMQNIKHAHHTG
jgi:hypothetical protein